MQDTPIRADQSAEHSSSTSDERISSLIRTQQTPGSFLGSPCCNRGQTKLPSLHDIH